MYVDDTRIIYYDKNRDVFQLFSTGMDEDPFTVPKYVWDRYVDTEGALASAEQAFDSALRNIKMYMEED